MITQVIDILMVNDIPTHEEELKIARGMYEYPNTFKKLWKKLIRKIKKIE
jgi:hypothetical protein